MSKTFIDIDNVKKIYQLTKSTTKQALKGVSLSINKGEVLGLLGVNGAGKTTLSSIIATLHPATSGEIRYNGISIYDQLTDYRKKIGFCPQRPNLSNDLTVRQNLAFSGRYYGLDKDETETRVAQLVKRYSLEEYLDAKPDTLSGGYKQRVMIARALVHKPELVILDEPTVGLDPHIRHQLWDEIRKLKAEGISVLLTTHYLDEAELLSDRVCILDKGQIKLVGTPIDLMTTFQKSRLEDVFLQLIEQDNQK
jgi:ABC-type multidrug transport system ATPase subunit